MTEQHVFEQAYKEAEAKRNERMEFLNGLYNDVFDIAAASGDLDSMVALNEWAQESREKIEADMWAHIKIALE